MDFLRTLQQDCRPDRLRLDLGANVGGHLHLMRQHGAGLIHAFEPVPMLARELTARYADDPHTVIFPNGVSDREYTDEGFCIMEAWTLDQAHRPGQRRAVAPLSMAIGGMSPEETFAIDFVTVDAHLTRYAPFVIFPGGKIQYTYPVVDFMKIDVDGYEPRVLRGAAATILRDRPPILIELSYHIVDLGEDVSVFLDFIYHALKYTLYLQDGTRCPRRWWDDHYPWTTSFDVAMVPQEWTGRVLD